MKAVVIAPVLALVLVGCASTDFPGDAPRVGERGIAQVVGFERHRRGGIEVVIYDTVRDDGRSCDEVYVKVLNEGGRPDWWQSLSRSRHSVLGLMAANKHTEVPEELCLSASWAVSE